MLSTDFIIRIICFDFMWPIQFGEYRYALQSKSICLNSMAIIYRIHDWWSKMQRLADKLTPGNASCQFCVLELPLTGSGNPLLKWTGHHRGEIKLSFWRDIWKLTDSISFREEILFFICFTPGNHWAIGEGNSIDSDEMLRNYTSSTAHNMWINTRLNCIFIAPWYFQSHWRIWQRKRKQVVNKFSIDHFFC